MNVLPQTSTGVPRHVVAGLLGLLLCTGLLLATPEQAAAAPRASPELAAEAAPAVSSADAAAPLFAAWYHRILGDRTRMIQVATIFMIVGIVILMWTRGK